MSLSSADNDQKQRHTCMTSKEGTLKKCEGSAEWLSGPVHILCAVSGPIEPRTSSQELINEAAIEIFLRPLSNVTSLMPTIWCQRVDLFLLDPADRWIEERVYATLRPILLTYLHPRTLVQVVFQVTQIEKAAVNAVRYFLDAVHYTKKHSICQF